MTTYAPLMPGPIERVGRDGSFVTVWTGAGVVDASIVMPVFRQAPYVRAAVESVIGQRDAVCEIIISDDDSGDETFAQAESAVQDALRIGAIPHRIVMRRGRQRLGRDHVHLLASAAQSDIVIQAHGDDLSYPHRVRRCLDAFASTGAAMVVSAWDDLDEHGRIRRPTAQANTPDRPIDLQTACDGDRVLIGAATAWRPDALSAFPPLCAERMPVGHDRLMSFRAFLTAGVTVVGQPLFARRLHDGNWSRRLVDHSSDGAEDFGWALFHVSHFSAMLDDLRVAVEKGVVHEPVASEARVILEANVRGATTSLVRAYGRQSSSGLQPLWVDDEMLRLAAEAALTQRLRRRARRLVPLQRGLKAVRRASSRIR